jgi:thiol-disulfide isomerase/thioredoxin
MNTKSLSFPIWIRCAIGIVAIIGVFAFHSEKAANAAEIRLANEGTLPDLGGAIAWVNSTPLNGKSLRGKVVLVNFWTYSCINSLRELPYMKEWAAKYKDAGLVVIGVHTPEFGFEKERANVENAVRELKVAYPVAIDSNHIIWQSFNNEYWPASYIIDAKGHIRYHHFGEGEYGECERAIQELLKENGATGVNESVVPLSAGGIEAPPSPDVRSPETYVGNVRAEHQVSSKRLTPLSLNQWGLSGPWDDGAEDAVLDRAPGRILFRFHARDLHMVLGAAKNRRTVHFKVTIDSAAPGNDCGIDVLPEGLGEVQEPRLYQLIRQKGSIEDRTFEIEFLDPGVRAFSFTFG